MKTNKKLFVVLPYYVILILVVVMLIVLSFMPKGYNGISRVKRLDFAGTYTYDGITKNFDYDDAINARKIEKVEINGHFKQSIPQKTRLFASDLYIRVKIIVNGEEILKFGYPEQNWNGFQSGGVGWIGTTLEKTITPEDDIKIILENPYGIKNYKEVYNYFMNTICNMDKYDLLMIMFTQNAAKIVIGVISVAFSALLVAVYFLLRLRKMFAGNSVIYGCIMIVITSLWILNAPEFSTLITNNPGFSMLYNTIASLLIPICVAQYLMGFTSGKRTMAMYVIRNLLIIALLGYAVLQVFGLTDPLLSGPYIIWFSNVLSVAGVVVCIIEIVKTDNVINRATCLVMAIFVSSMFIEAMNIFLEVFRPGEFATFAFTVYLVGQAAISITILGQSLLRARQAAVLEKEILEKQIAVALSQIQPHFLYNSLNAIEDLCYEDSEKAAKTINDFAQYLRENLDSLKGRDLVLFSQELKHTKTYLNLEQLRMGDKLRVEYDIKEENFMLPTLTLQPIVENAVRHGIFKKDGPGTVKISTRLEKDHAVIVVEDDGVGFNTSINGKTTEDGERSHIGIINVERRLRAQAGGKLEIDSIPGKGTIIKIHGGVKE